ncbi:MAG: hypothetical protein IJ925_08465 [Muribaculaceae bacterium]|nr:hypothetical protein [Muribaculaceae bacterium]
MKRIAILTICILTLMPVAAIELDYSNDHKVAAGLRMGMSMLPSLDFEITGEYRPLRYVGVNVGLLYTTPFINQTNVSANYIDNEHLVWEIKSYRNACYRIAGRAGVQFTTPAIMLSHNEMGLSFRISPGITIPIPTNKGITVSNYEVYKKSEIFEDADENDTQNIKIFNSTEDFENSGGKFLYWHTRAEMVIEYEEQWEFMVGYCYSDFDVYGGSRKIEIHGTPLVKEDKKPKPMHSFQLGFTYKF